MLFLNISIILDMKMNCFFGLNASLDSPEMESGPDELHTLHFYPGSVTSLFCDTGQVT